MDAFNSTALLKSVEKKVRKIALNLSETELAVEEATNNEHWGPHGSAMAEIADDCYDPVKYKEVMAVIARRLADTDENWRHVYKALLLLEYLVKNGPIKVYHELQGDPAFLEGLTRFEYKDKMGKDEGINVRNRARQLILLIKDQNKVLEEREKSKKNRAKYVGASRDTLRNYPEFENSIKRDDYVEAPTYMAEVSESGISVKKLERKSSFEFFTGDPLPGENEHSEDEVEENPFEATRQRIEKLKKDGHLFSCQKSDAVTVALPKMQVGNKEIKKISQVRVNPEIAATFSKIKTVVANNPPRTNDSLDLFSELGKSHTATSTLETKQPRSVEVSADLNLLCSDPVSFSDLSLEKTSLDMNNISSAMDPFSEIITAPPEKAMKSSAIADLGLSESPVIEWNAFDTDKVAPIAKASIDPVSSAQIGIKKKLDPFSSIDYGIKKSGQVPMMGTGKSYTVTATDIQNQWGILNSVQTNQPQLGQQQFNTSNFGHTQALPMQFSNNLNFGLNSLNQPSAIPAAVRAPVRAPSPRMGVGMVNRGTALSSQRKDPFSDLSTL